MVDIDAKKLAKLLQLGCRVLHSGTLKGYCDYVKMFSH